ncbi:hypothetical protein SLEP1_g23516 [Rubroshorea leprosula]|uniref:Uncharacterized protein n=1 Tax=Rubroshorea leprosula TaxID=152421 RepID=A0AAV5JIU4_9ROSI|nr:hypothetical protein SLEP1_g23516 [Rubroshorea leprosula]
MARHCQTEKEQKQVKKKSLAGRGSMVGRKREENRRVRGISRVLLLYVLLGYTYSAKSQREDMYVCSLYL